MCVKKIGDHWNCLFWPKVSSDFFPGFNTGIVLVETTVENHFKENEIGTILRISNSDAHPRALREGRNRKKFPPDWNVHQTSVIPGSPRQISAGNVVFSQRIRVQDVMRTRVSFSRYFERLSRFRIFSWLHGYPIPIMKRNWSVCAIDSGNTTYEWVLWIKDHSPLSGLQKRFPPERFFLPEYNGFSWRTLRTPKWTKYISGMAAVWKEG